MQKIEELHSNNESHRDVVQSIALSKVILSGHLGDRFGKEWEFDINSPAEAIRALRANCVGFDEAVIEYEPGYHVFVGSDNIGEEQLFHPSSNQTIIIAPVIAGGGVKDILTVIVGAVLIYSTWGGASSALAGAMKGAYTAATITATTAFVAQLGVALVLSGISSLLTKNNKQGGEQSHIFNGAENTVAQGESVPIGYGRMRVGSRVISVGIYEEQVSNIDMTKLAPTITPAGEIYRGPALS